MENIDDLMRQKFDSDDPGERFEFQEEFWEQAQLLLEQEEKRRRGVLWLFFGLAVALGLLAWFLLSTSGLRPLGSNDTKDTKGSETSLESFEKQGQSKSYNSNSNLQNNSNTLVNDANSGSENTVKQRENGIEKSENQSVSENSKDSASGKGKTTNGSKSGRLNERANTAQNTAQTQANRSAKSGKTDALSVNPLSGSNPKTTEKADVLNQKNAVLEPNTLGQNPGGQNLAETPGSAPTRPDTTTAATKAVPVLTPQMGLFNLPTPLVPFVIPARELKIKTIQPAGKQPIVQETKPAKDKRFAFGLSLAGTVNQSTDTAGRWAGFAFGGYGQYRINPKWSLRLGAQWRFVPGFEAFSSPDSSNPAFVEQIRYSFGYTAETWKLETAGLHSIEIPISTQWNRGRFGAEAGLTLGANFMVQTSTTKTVSSSLNPTPVTTVSRFERGSLSPYKQVYGAALLGAEYRLNARIAVMARGHYRFTQTLKNATTNSGLGSLDLGLRWRLY